MNTEKADGQNYAPKGKPSPVCRGGEFPVGVIGLAHGHIYGMCNGLTEAGANIAAVFDTDGAKIDAFLKNFPDTKVAGSEGEILNSQGIKLVASASIPDERADLGVRVLDSGKDYFCDKPPLVTRAQLAAARAATARTGRRYSVYYSERLHVEASVYADELIKNGAIGRVIHIDGFGPHRPSVSTRPDWFFDKKRNGGILVDIGCHQIEQILHFAGANDAKINSSRVQNYEHKNWPNFQDFGDATLTCDNGATAFFRVDWFTPAGLGAWGDGRTIIVGSKGTIELRKYINIATDGSGDHVYLANDEGEFHFSVGGKCGFPFFGQLVRDCLDGTNNAMAQDYTFRVIELAIEAQELAENSIKDILASAAKRI